MLRRALVLLTVAAMILMARPEPSAAAVSAAAAEGEFLLLLNQQRASAGLGLVVLDPSLSAVARSWSGSMAKSGIAHNPSLVAQVEGSVTTAWSSLAENVGVGYSVPGLHAAFWASLPHRANLVGAYNRVGIGVVVSGTTIWVTANFLAGPAIGGPTGVSPCSEGGYLLDAYGGVHSTGGAPPVSSSAYWPGWDVARDVSLTAARQGQVLDGWGGLHAVSGAPSLESSPLWPGWDIARAVAVTPEGTGGYVLDGFGGVHAVGSAAAVPRTAYWPGWDIANDIQIDPLDSSRGYVLDGYGGLHPFGGMPAARLSWYGGSGAAPSFVFLAGGRGGYITDATGHAHPFAVGNAAMPAAVSRPIPSSGNNALGGLPDGLGLVMVGASGAEIGFGSGCAKSAPWGTWNVIRALEPAS